MWCAWWRCCVWLEESRILFSPSCSSILTVHDIWLLILFFSLFSFHLKDFDTTYGPAWHCIVGTSFGSYVTHSLGGFLYFSVDKVYILLFRTAVQPLAQPQWDLKSIYSNMCRCSANVTLNRIDDAQRTVAEVIWSVHRTVEQPCLCDFYCAKQLCKRSCAFVCSYRAWLSDLNLQLLLYLKYEWSLLSSFNAPFCSPNYSNPPLGLGPPVRPPVRMLQPGNKARRMEGLGEQIQRTAATRGPPPTVARLLSAADWSPSSLRHRPPSVRSGCRRIRSFVRSVRLYSLPFLRLDW